MAPTTPRRRRRPNFLTVTLRPPNCHPDRSGGIFASERQEISRLML